MLMDGTAQKIREPFLMRKNQPVNQNHQGQETHQGQRLSRAEKKPGLQLVGGDHRRFEPVPDIHGQFAGPARACRMTLGKKHVADDHQRIPAVALDPFQNFIVTAAYGVLAAATA